MGTRNLSILVRLAVEGDLPALADMTDHNAIGHPAEKHPRPISKLRDAYFGAQPVARLLVATRDDRVIGTCQWTRIYDLYWAAFGGYVEWLYVRPEVRGLGVPAVLMAEICREVREAGGEFLHGGAETEITAALYDRVGMSWPSRSVYVSGEAFQQFADLAGKPARDIVRRLPHPELNKTAARARNIGP